MFSPVQAICSRAGSAGRSYRHGLLISKRAQTLGLRYLSLNPSSLGRRYSTTASELVPTIPHTELPSQDGLSLGYVPRMVIPKTNTDNKLQTQSLPITCPGCGALSQESSPEEAGHYSRLRRAVRHYLKSLGSLDEQSRIVRANDIQGDQFPKSAAAALSTTIKETEIPVPVCDRCHDLIYNAKGHSIAHPSVEDIADSIAESPFERNHVYHVLDAADFPMSLISNIFDKLELAKPRSQNRRSRHRFAYKPTISFIITRSDLLGATKDDVDRMMPYFQRVLRSALGRTGQGMRLGDVHLVSAKRGWWTKEIKDDIWERGGGNWMVGRVNVGKSNLFEVIFPKGSGDRAPKYAELREQQDEADGAQNTEVSDAIFSESSLLPPAQPEVPFPAMPIVSSLPGTTASPIRLPFGNHKGELIDLPGIARGNLEEHVLSNHKLDLVMRSRPSVEQYIIKANQSLLLGGGLIRITPQFDENTTMLAYPFLPIKAHVTSTKKAIGAQTQERQSGIRSIVADEASAAMSSAGVLSLTTDVTKSRAEPLIRAGLSADKLIFRVYSTDVLIEGVGWIELVCQVRRRHSESTVTPSNESSSSLESTLPLSEDVSDGRTTSSPFTSKSSFRPFLSQPMEESAPPPPVIQTDASGRFLLPRVEIFSPNGKHISQREPLQAWLSWEEHLKHRKKAASDARPRKSMKGAKKQEKRERQAGKHIQSSVS